MATKLDKTFSDKILTSLEEIQAPQHLQTNVMALIREIHRLESQVEKLESAQLNAAQEAVAKAEPKVMGSEDIQ